MLGVPRSPRGTSLTDLAQQLTSTIEREHPRMYCWGCHAARLGTDEAKLREAGQQVLIDAPHKFALAKRTCAGCRESDSLLAFTPHEASDGASRKCLLVVDDEPEIIAILQEHFGDRYDVCPADSGTEALNQFGKRRPDAVFLDITMPGIDGLQTLKLLRQIDAGVPIVMVTANADVGVAEECLKAGAFSWVPKPINLLYMDHLAALATAQESGRRDSLGHPGDKARHPRGRSAR